MVLTYVYHIRTGHKEYYRNFEVIDLSQYNEIISDNKNCRITFITDLTRDLPLKTGYPDTLEGLLLHLSQFECFLSQQETIVYKDNSEWEKGMFV